MKKKIWKIFINVEYMGHFNENLHSKKFFCTKHSICVLWDKKFLYFNFEYINFKNFNFWKVTLNICLYEEKYF